LLILGFHSGIIDVNSVHGLLHHVAVGNVADVLEAVGTYEMSAELLTMYGATIQEQN
jgi:hypothetical protein